MSETPRTDELKRGIWRLMQSQERAEAYAWRDAIHCGIEQLERALTAEREKIACIEMDRDHARLDAKTERERADRLQIAVDGASGLLTYAAHGADRCCNRPCHEVEEMVRRSAQMRDWVLKYGKWKMGIAYPETEAAISASIDAARRK